MKNKQKIKLMISSFLVLFSLMLGKVAFAAEPTLKNVNTYASNEIQIAIGIIALGLCIFLFLKQKIGAVIGVVLASAFLYFMASDPKLIFSSIGSLFSKIFGGG